MTPSHLYSFSWCVDSNLGWRFLQRTVNPEFHSHCFVTLVLHNNMPHLTAEAKHHILLEYTPRDTTHSFNALARRHGVKGGKRTLIRWHQRWDGTAASLEQHQRSGRPRTLTPAEVSRHIRAPVLAANRAHRAIHYPDIWRQVETKTGKKITLRTVQRTGKDTLAIKERTTRKRTQAECVSK